MLFQLMVGWRPKRQATTASQISVEAVASAKASPPNSGWKPGAKRATLAAGLLGTPVIIATQMTQMTTAADVKKSTENQSIKALTLRLSVGSAKAASTARAGNAISSARSEPASNKHAMLAPIVKYSGVARCG